MHTVGSGDFQRAIDALSAAQSATILCHVQPDADALGSALGLAQVLAARGVSVEVSFPGAEIDQRSGAVEIQSLFRGFPGQAFLIPSSAVCAAPELLIAVDCASADRLAELSDRLDAAGTSVVFDHHASNTLFGAINIVDAAACSTTALIADLVDQWQIPLTKDVAHCLYAGLVTDTGSFRWANAHAHELAARMLATGIVGSAISRSLLDAHPFAWLSMVSKVLARATLIPEAHRGAGLSYAVAELPDLGELAIEEFETVVDFMRATTEAKIAAVFKQRATPGDWTVSLRSRDEVEVGRIAIALGGGGHRYAAGYSATGTVEQVVAQLIAELG